MNRSCWPAIEKAIGPLDRPGGDQNAIRRSDIERQIAGRFQVFDCTPASCVLAAVAVAPMLAITRICFTSGLFPRRRLPLGNLSRTAAILVT
jgi:hypothetical protein